MATTNGRLLLQSRMVGGQVIDAIAGKHGRNVVMRRLIDGP